MAGLSGTGRQKISVSCQSCWLNRDGSIHANLGLRQADGTTSWRKFRFCDGEVTMERFKPIQFGEISHDAFYGFVTENIADVLDLVIGLLEPKEKQFLLRSRK